MDDKDLDKLYQAKGKQGEDLTRIKKLVAVKEHLDKPKTMFGFGTPKCPKCDSPLVKKTIKTKDENITYLSCSSLECKYEYASSVKRTQQGFGFNI